MPSLALTSLILLSVFRKLSRLRVVDVASCGDAGRISSIGAFGPSTSRRQDNPLHEYRKSLLTENILLVQPGNEFSSQVEEI
jgi:hypothetical protein